MPAINSKREYEKLAVVVHVLKSTQTVAILRCCFANDGYKRFKDLKCTCIVIFMRIKPLFGDVSVVA